MEKKGEKPYPNISCLFPEVLAMIFSYLNVKDKGRVSQVCVKWRDAAYNRLVWRGDIAKLHLRRSNPSLFSSLVKRGIRRIQILSLKRNLREVIDGVPNLEILDLSGCFNVTDHALSHAFSKDLSTIAVLNLSLCKQITDTSLNRIARSLTNLEVLELGGCCNITNNGLYVIAWGLRKLKTLNLRSCSHISDAGIGHLAGLTPSAALGTLELENLGLQDCQKLTDQALKNVSVGLTNLKRVNLSFCASITDAGLKFLAKMPSLRDLDLRSCDNISDTGIGYLAESGSRITKLDVSFCDKIGDQALFRAQGLFGLQSISLCACNISDDGISRLVSALQELTTLNIGQCVRITDKGLGIIADHLKNLQSIDLYGCTRITTVGLEKIMKLRKLSTLNLGLWHKR